MIKKAIFIIFVSLFAFVNVVPVCASDTHTVKENSIDYDLVQGGTQEFTIYDETGEEIEVTIRELYPQTRSIDNGTYEISTSRTGSWNAKFQITIQNYKIASGGHASAIAVTGSFISKRFEIESSTMATYYLKRKVGIVISNMYLRAQIENKNLKVIVR